MSFISSPTISQTEIALRLKDEENVIKTGIQFVDDATGGIHRNELLLLGGPSGVGKTETCCNIAWENILSGKVVHYIALEAEQYEIERRIKYKIFFQLYIKESRQSSWLLNYKNWRLGRFAIEHADLEAECASIFENQAKGLFTYYKQSKFDVAEFIKIVLYCANETDLIIVDHVHYFDFDDQNENRAIKEIAKTARELSIHQGKPIILVSHIRKSDRFSKSKCPGLEDFHGSSDLFKIATKAITFAPGTHYSNNGKSETYMRIVKDRFDGSLQNHMACLVFNSMEGRYEKRYKIGPSSQNRDEEFHAYPSNSIPAWAKHVRQ